MSTLTRTERMEALVAELRERTAQVARGGGEAAVERHRSRGKMTARERINRLVDPGAAFLELSALAAWDMYDDSAPSAGIVTGKAARRNKFSIRAASRQGNSTSATDSQAAATFPMDMASPCRYFP